MLRPIHIYWHHLDLMLSLLAPISITFLCFYHSFTNRNNPFRSLCFRYPSFIPSSTSRHTSFWYHSYRNMQNHCQIPFWLVEWIEFICRFFFGWLESCSLFAIFAFEEVNECRTHVHVDVTYESPFSRTSAHFYD